MGFPVNNKETKLTLENIWLCMDKQIISMMIGWNKGIVDWNNKIRLDVDSAFRKKDALHFFIKPVFFAMGFTLVFE